MVSEGQLRPESPILLAVAALLPLAFAVPLFEPFTAAKQLILAGGAALALLAWLIAGGSRVESPLWSPLAALGLLCAVSLARVNRFDTAIMMLAALVLFLAAGSALAGISSRETLSTLFTAVGTVEAVYVLWQALAGDPVLPAGELPGKWRAFGTFGNPNWTGEFLAAAILVTFGRLLDRPARMSALCLTVMTAALGATFARGAWLSLAVGVALVFFCRRGVPRSLQTLLIVAGCAFAAAAFFAFRDDTARYLSGIDSIRGRLWIWLVTASMIWHHPLGVGLGAFGLHFPEYQARLYESGWSRVFADNASFTSYAHNDYLQIVAEAGVPAIPVIALLVWRIARRGPELAQDGVALGCWAAVAAMMVNALYAFPFYLPGSLGCTAILLGAVEAQRAKNRTRTLHGAWRWAGAGAGLACCCGALFWCWRLGSVEYRLNLASQAIALRRWPEAGVVLEKAMRNDPAHMEIHSLQGRVQLAERKFSMAAASYERAAGLGFSEEVFAGRATALWHGGQSDAALAVLAQLARLRPDLRWPRERLAELRARSETEESSP